MICKNCGVEIIVEGSKFCNNCGSKIEPDIETVKTDPEPEYYDPYDDIIKKKTLRYDNSIAGQLERKTGINKKVIALIIALIVGLIVASQNGLLSKITDSLSLRSKDVTVSVTDKKSLPSNWREGRLLDEISVDLSVRNNSSRVIKGIEGKLIIYDMFGKQLMKEQADITGTFIKVGETSRYTFSFHANSLIEKEVTAFETDYKNLKFSYDVTKIVYN